MERRRALVIAAATATTTVAAAAAIAAHFGLLGVGAADPTPVGTLDAGRVVVVEANPGPALAPTAPEGRSHGPSDDHEEDRADHDEGHEDEDD